MIAVAVLAACLFPLAPYQIKIVVVYLSMGILVTLMGAILIRGGIAGVTWMAVGRSFWLLPNVLSEVQCDLKKRDCCYSAHSQVMLPRYSWCGPACAAIIGVPTT